MFLNEKHKENFRILEEKIGSIYAEWIAMKPMLYIIAGNQELMGRVDDIVNFKDYNFKCYCEDGELRIDRRDWLSNSEVNLVKLGLECWNSSNECLTVGNLFECLDDDNRRLALNAIRIRYRIY